MINVNNVFLNYSNVLVLNNINLHFEKADRVALIGPSGCGKSSLLYMLAGLLQPSQGNIFIEEKEVYGPNAKVALILQGLGLFPWKTVLENAELSLTINKISKEKRREKVIPILRSLGLEKHMHKYPTQLSGGQKQRVAITRALASECEILLMDEPFSALDALSREHLQKFIINLWQEKQLTIVLVTHSIEEAVFLGNKIVVLSPQPGKIKAIIKNTNSGCLDFRSSQDFYKQCNYVREVLEGVGI